jgi:hypothetical protein
VQLRKRALRKPTLKPPLETTCNAPCLRQQRIFGACSYGCAIASFQVTNLIMKTPDTQESKYCPWWLKYPHVEAAVSKRSRKCILLAASLLDFLGAGIVIVKQCIECDCKRSGGRLDEAGPERGQVSSRWH